MIQVFARKVFSSEGSNDLQREKTTYIYFTDLLEEMEDIQLDVCVKNLTLHGYDIFRRRSQSSITIFYWF